MLLLLFGVLALNYTQLMSRVRSLRLMEFFALTTDVFFKTVSHLLVPRYASARMRYESDRMGVIGRLGLRCCPLVQSLELL